MIPGDIEWQDYGYYYSGDYLRVYRMSSVEDDIYTIQVFKDKAWRKLDFIESLVTQFDKLLNGNTAT